jgi:polar amino acid transport system substrate-binding protein
MHTKKAISLLALLLASQALCAQVTRICYEDAENIPWNTADGQGLNNRLVRMAAAQNGMRVDLIALPWKRCLIEVADGRVDGAIGASFNDERASFAAYPMAAPGKPDPARRIRFDGYSFYRLKGSPANWDGNRFVHLSDPISAQLGYAIVRELKTMGVAVEESSGDAAQHMRKLTQGHVPLVALLNYEGTALLQDPEFADRVERIPTAFSKKPYFVIFSRPYYDNNRQAVEDFWAAVAVARESPAFRKLVRDKLRE